MSDRQFAVLSATGTDRPGLVAKVAGYLSECGCNIEDSRMATLGGEFGIMVLISGPPDAIARAIARSSELAESVQLQVTMKPTRSPDAPSEETARYVVTVHGLDHEGIVHAVTDALHELGANIVSVETETYSAPVTGSPLFRMEATADLPPHVDLQTLRERLAPVAASVNVDVDARLA